MQVSDVIVSEIRDLGKSWKPNILVRTKKAIIFREVEDLIAWILRHRKRVIAYRVPAWRFICREGDGANRYYYMIEIVYANRNVRPDSVLNPFISLENGEAKELKLIAGDATDYSGPGFKSRRPHHAVFQAVLRLGFSPFKKELFDLSQGG